MDFSLDLKSNQILKKMRQHPERAKKGARKGLLYAGRYLQNEARVKIKDKSSKTGRIYTYRGRTHQASAPGEYPANRSGNLVKNIEFQILSSEKLEFGAKNGAPYAISLELGNKTGNRMKPRPFLDKTVQNNKLKILNIIGKEIEKEIIR